VVESESRYINSFPKKPRIIAPSNVPSRDQRLKARPSSADIIDNIGVWIVDHSLKSDTDPTSYYMTCNDDMPHVSSRLLFT
jgi:hypothetical protein